jgi:two-component SAPR family response regulator
MTQQPVAPLTAAPSVLVVEDETVIASDLQRFLGGRGFHVVGPVGCLDDALSKIIDEKLDGAVLDVTLGGDVASRVADALTAAKVPYVFVNGHAVPLVSETYRDHRLLNNPYDYHSLLDGLTSAMGDKADRPSR